MRSAAEEQRLKLWQRLDQQWRRKPSAGHLTERIKGLQVDWSLAKGEVNQPPIERLSGISGRQLEIEETLEWTRLCLGSEAKSVFEAPQCFLKSFWAGGPPVELGRNRTRLDLPPKQGGHHGGGSSPEVFPQPSH